MVKTYNWYCGDKHTSTIWVDFGNKRVEVKHFSDNPFECAFRGDTNISFDSFEFMISRRCFPKHRVDAAEQMAKIGVSEYDPYKIIEKTQGVMAGDPYRIVPVEA